MNSRQPMSPGWASAVHADRSGFSSVVARVIEDEAAPRTRWRQHLVAAIAATAGATPATTGG